MKNYITIMGLLAGLLFGLTGYSQQRSSKTFSYYQDYIITKKDTLFGEIDPSSIHSSTIRITGKDDKIRNVKAGKVIELKSRFKYKTIDINGQSMLLKVLTEGPVSLYSAEMKGSSSLSDKEPEEIRIAREVPSRSTFYLLKNGRFTQLDRVNYKPVLLDLLEPDEQQQAIINEMEFPDLEFTLLNMVIGYNFRKEKD